MFQKENRVNLIHIESRPSKTEKGRYEFYVDCKAATREILMEAIEKLKEKFSIKPEEKIIYSELKNKNEEEFFTPRHHRPRHLAGSRRSAPLHRSHHCRPPYSKSPTRGKKAYLSAFQ